MAPNQMACVKPEFTDHTLEFDFQLDQPLSGTGQYNDSTPLTPLTLIAHDMRGPLASLRALIELVDAYRDSKSRDRSSSCIARAHNIIDALDEMLDSVLVRVREFGDPLGFEPRLVDLNEIIKAAMTTSRPIADAQLVELQHSSVLPLVVRGDRQLLQQAFENLIGNAIKHSGAGTTVKCEAVAEFGRILVRISDEGCGLSVDDRKRAFQPFSSLSTKSNTGSTSHGLGLWIVRLIAERHGGTINVDKAAPGGGACFTLELSSNWKR